MSHEALLFARSARFDGPPAVAIISLIVGIIVGQRGIADDEAAMFAKFGDEYARYVGEPDAIIPSLR